MSRFDQSVRQSYSSWRIHRKPHVLICLRTLGSGKNLNSLLLNHFRILGAKTPGVAYPSRRSALRPTGGRLRRRILSSSLPVPTHEKPARLTPSFSTAALHFFLLFHSCRNKCCICYFFRKTPGVVRISPFQIHRLYMQAGFHPIHSFQSARFASRAAVSGKLSLRRTAPLAAIKELLESTCH